MPASDNLVQSVHQYFFDQYERYREKRLDRRRFKHRDLVPLLLELRGHPLFRVEVAGYSVEGREIFLITVGWGPVPVLLWSQMHGDEPTATLALLDLFHFFRQTDEADGLRNEILAGVTLYFLPMLNPDGAECFTRRNALGIDLNRDALRQQSPEAQLLKNIRDRLAPRFGFNLHDQHRYHAAGNSGHPATLSFLAPPSDAAKTVNETRAAAMRVIVGMHDALQTYLPERMGKFSDDFETRAFGDNIQRWGTSVILLESGGYAGDPERQIVRKLGGVALLHAFYAIATGAYHQESINAYYQIPENQTRLFDLIIRNVSVSKGNQTYQVDVGINRPEITLANGVDFACRSRIEDLGDLSVYVGYEELDATGLVYEAGQAWPLPNGAALDRLDAGVLIKEGYLAVRVSRARAQAEEAPRHLYVVTESRPLPEMPAIEQIPYFYLSQHGQRVHAIVNGFVVPLTSGDLAFRQRLAELPPFAIFP